MKRALALYIPFLTADRLRNLRSTACNTLPGHGKNTPKNEAAPAATIALHGGVMRIVHVNARARRLGLYAGQTLADARAMVPRLVTYRDDPAADRRQLETLAVRADGLSPAVHLEGQDTLLLDVTGCGRLFGGEENLLRRATEELAAQGFSVRAALADTAGAAWALSHAHPAPVVISRSGQVASDLVPLPVWSLRIGAEATASLASVGVETVGTLLHLPRSAVAARFGEAVLNRLDQALGDRPEVFTAFRPTPVVTSGCTFGVATRRLDVLYEGVHRALEQLCEQLARRAAGVCQLFVTLDCGDSAPARTITRPVSLSRPTRSVRHLFSLLRVALEGFSLPGPVEAVTLWTRETEPLDDWQEELFHLEPDSAPPWAVFVDRLVARLGAHAVVRAEPVSDHQPERAFQYVPLTGGTSMTSRGPKSAAQIFRPLRLYPQPVEIAAAAIVPEGPPVAFRWEGAAHAVAESAGPERIETGWWRGRHVRRDYYRTATAEGRRCWLFRNRDTGRWFLHGWFD